MENYLEPIFQNYESSFQIFKELLTTDYEIDAYPPAVAKNQTFGGEFPGSLIQKPQYKNCLFINSQFESADGLLSRFHECSFYGCFLNNCDLRYCDILDSTFCTKQQPSIISSCNFSFGNFINSQFINVDFSGCSFRQMQLDNTAFKHCTMQHCSIEQSNIKNCIFEDLDLRKVGVRYCAFENTTFNSVTFHILDLARNFGLIQQLQNSTQPILVAYKNDKTMSFDDAVTYLYKLIPYYFEKNQFYELINVYAAFGEYSEAINILPYAFENVILACDFAALLDLCSLIVKMEICTAKQLRDFYTQIKQLVIPDKFPHYLRKNYNTYIENIKYILVDNPYDNPEANIILKTDIDSLSDNDMHQLLLSIEVNIRELAPNIDVSIQLTHHSPYDILIVLIGALPEVLTICQIFYYVLGGSKAFSDLKNSHKEKVIKNDKKIVPNSGYTDQKSVKRVELSLGKIFSFKYEKEFNKRVKSLEYMVK